MELNEGDLAIGSCEERGQLARSVRLARAGRPLEDDLTLVVQEVRHVLKDARFV